MKQCLSLFVFAFLASSCYSTKIVRYENGNKKILFRYDHKKKLKASKTWYESGELERKSKIIALDTIIVFDSILNDSTIYVDIKESAKEWYESGKIKKEFSVQADGTRKITYWSEEGIKIKEEIYLANKLIKVTTY